jgi:single-strand DNA-binding protein
MKTNNVLLIGYVGADPVIKVTDKGMKRTMIRVATHMPKLDESGEKIWNTVWHDIVAWNITAEYASQNFVKGSKIMVDGCIEYRIILTKTDTAAISHRSKRKAL